MTSFDTLASSTGLLALTFVTDATSLAIDSPSCDFSVSSAPSEISDFGFELVEAAFLISFSRRSPFDVALKTSFLPEILAAASDPNVGQSDESASLL